MGVRWPRVVAEDVARHGCRAMSAQGCLERSDAAILGRRTPSAQRSPQLNTATIGRRTPQLTIRTPDAGSAGYELSAPQKALVLGWAIALRLRP